eukprot:6490307-Amphidinium_carterae.1
MNTSSDGERWQMSHLNAAMATAGPSPSSPSHCSTALLSAAIAIGTKLLPAKHKRVPLEAMLLSSEHSLANKAVAPILAHMIWLTPSPEGERIFRCSRSEKDAARAIN